MRSFGLGCRTWDSHTSSILAEGFAEGGFFRKQGLKCLATVPDLDPDRQVRFSDLLPITNCDATKTNLGAQMVANWVLQ